MSGEKVQLSRFYPRTETESSLRNVVLKQKRKIRAMDFRITVTVMQ
jgi:hypothetical protein